jgi:hypothetical protein
MHSNFHLEINISRVWEAGNKTRDVRDETVLHVGYSKLFSNSLLSTFLLELAYVRDIISSNKNSVANIHTPTLSRVCQWSRPTY